MYGRDNTKIVVYNIRRWTKEKKRGEYQAIFCNKTVNFCNFVHDNISFSGHPRIDFLISFVFHDL